MYRWIPYAFVRITFFFCSGTFLGIGYGSHFSLTVLLISSVMLSGGFVLCVLCRRGKSVFAGALAAFAITATGMLNTCLSDESRRTDHLIRQEGNMEGVRAVVESAVMVRPRTWKYEVVIDQAMFDGHWQNAYSRALLYVRKDSITRAFVYGDVLMIRDAPKIIPAPLNPWQFDLQKFQRYRQVYFQVMTSSDRISFIGNRPSHALIGLAITARLWAEDVLERHIKGVRARAIASAFVLGITDGLDNELITAYAATGSMHVLSVSGLHVGIVYWLLLLFFKPFPPRSVRWPLFVVSLLVLWVYAFVTGISASVLRAVVMFTFASIARAWNYRINMYNILSATAFVLLVYDPFMIMSVGFQLSFVAVLGIVALQPVLYRLWEPKRWIMDEGWKLVAVSIAAQVATVPLCLLYFHQFPNYFLLANLFMGPGSFMVLIMGIFVLMTAAVDPIANVTGWLLEKLIDFLNFLIVLVERMPYSVVDNIFITPAQCAVLAAGVGAVMICSNGYSPRWAAAALVLTIVLSMLSWWNAIEMRRPVITVYAITGATAIDLMADYVTEFIGTPAAPSSYVQQSGNRIARQCADRVTPLKGISLHSGAEIFIWRGQRILWIYGDEPPTRQLTADLVVISNNSVRDLSAFSHLIVAKCYVIDGSNRPALSAQLATEADFLKLRVHPVMRDGAFEWRL